jgi:muramidase (phage lysozyme)
MALTRANLREALTHPNVVAFYRVVREKESGQTADAYTLINGGSHFTSFADHPYGRLRTTQGGKAAGAPQFLPTTWGELVDQYGFEDFSPPNQDQGYVGLLVKRGALADVMAGRFEAAVAKCRLEWSSLPGASESRSSWTLDKARVVYEAWGGKLAPDVIGTVLADEQPAAPIEERSEPYIGPPIVGGADNSNAPQEGTHMPIAFALLAQLLPSVLSLFSGRAQATIAEKTGADPKVAADFMQGLIQKIGGIVGQPVTDNASAIAAVAALHKQIAEDADKIKLLENDAQDYLHDLTTAAGALLDSHKQDVQIATTSADAAANRKDSRILRAKLLRWVVIVFAVLSAILLGIAVVQIVYGASHQADGTIIGAFILAFGNAGGWFAAYVHFSVGTTESSGAKDLYLGEMASRRKTTQEGATR